MTLETLFSHPAEYAKCHRESPEVQAFKQSPPKPSVTLRQLRKTNKLAAYGTRWDTLTQRTSSRQPRPTTTFWDVIEDNGQDDEPQYGYDDDEPEEEIRPPTRRRQRTTILDEEEDENDEDYKPFNTPESSGEHALFITQPDPEEYHEPGTLSRTEKGKGPATRKRSSSTSNVWARFGFSADTTTSPATSPPAPKRKQTAPRTGGTRAPRATTRGRGRRSRGQRGQPTGWHTYFDYLK